MVEKLLAGLGLAACLVVLLGMVLGARRRWALRAWALQLRGRLKGLLQWRRRRGQAKREAAQAIERARRAVERDGNVYRPDAFGHKLGGKRPPDDRLH